jgi:Zn-dependent protease
VPFSLNISPEIVVALALILLICLPVHEFSHALLAYRLGDGTAKLFGRLTLNPIAHLDPIGSLFLVLTVVTGARGLGWAKPTPVNPANLRYGAAGDAIVAFAGPASNLVLAAAVALPLRLIINSPTLFDQVPEFAQNVMFYFVSINVALFVFNLIPVPPLDGSHILLAALDPRTAFQLRPVLAQYGPFLLLILVFTGIASIVIAPIIDRLVDILVGLPFG